MSFESQSSSSFFPSKKEDPGLEKQNQTWRPSLVANTPLLRGAAPLCASVFAALVLAFCAAVIVAAPAQAEDKSGNIREGDSVDYLSFGAGYFDVIQQEDEAADFRLEYRSDLKLWIIQPWVGLEVTSDGAVWGGAGIHTDWYITDHIVATPSIGVGGYAQGNGPDLGSVFEIRSQLELAYEFDNRARLGLAFSHTSNASWPRTTPASRPWCSITPCPSASCSSGRPLSRSCKPPGQEAWGQPKTCV